MWQIYNFNVDNNKDWTIWDWYWYLIHVSVTHSTGSRGPPQIINISSITIVGIYLPVSIIAQPFSSASAKTRIVIFDPPPLNHDQPPPTKWRSFLVILLTHFTLHLCFYIYMFRSVEGKIAIYCTFMNFLTNWSFCTIFDLHDFRPDPFVYNLI